MKTILLSITVGYWFLCGPGGEIKGYAPTKTSDYVAPALQPGWTAVEDSRTPKLLRQELGPPHTQDGTARWHRVDDKTIGRRPLLDIAAEDRPRKRKRLVPLLLQARRAWREAVELQSADPTSISTDEVDALQQEFLDLRGQLGGP